MKHAFIQKGFIVESRERKPAYFSKLFSLSQWLKEILTYYSVPFSDPCCDTNSEFSQVRYNKTDSVLEYFDGTNWVTTA